MNEKKEQEETNYDLKNKDESTACTRTTLRCAAFLMFEAG